MENIPSQEKTSISVLEHNTERSSLKEKNNSISDEEIRQIGQYTLVYGPNSAVKKLKKTFPHLKFGESKLLVPNTRSYLGKKPVFKDLVTETR